MKLETLKNIADKCKASALEEQKKNEGIITDCLDGILGNNDGAFTYKIRLDEYQFGVAIMSGSYECSVKSPWRWEEEDEFELETTCYIYSNKENSKEYANMYWAAYMMVTHEEELRSVLKALTWEESEAHNYASAEVEREERRIRNEEENKIKDEVKARIQVGATFYNLSDDADWDFDKITKVTDKCVYTTDECGFNHRFKYNDVVHSLYWAEIRYRENITDDNQAMPIDMITVKYRMWNKEEGYNADQMMRSEPFPISERGAWLPEDYDEETMYIAIDWYWGVLPYFPKEGE